MKNISAVPALSSPIHSSSTVVGCIEILNQGLEFLLHLDPEDYTAILAPHVSSSIGEHYRHWLDLFHAIRLNPQRIDYNLRRRGHPVEREINIAKKEIIALMEWLYTLNHEQLSQTVNVEVEVMISQTRVEEATSTMVREIGFAALHATHHFAMAKVVASLRGMDTDASFGVAPTTASYQRAQ